MPLYYLMPLKLSSDSTPGFCIQLYDHDRDELDVPCVKRCGNLDENPNRPAHYPQLIFAKPISQHLLAPAEGGCVFQ